MADLPEDACQKVLAMFKSIDACQWAELAQYFHSDVCYLRPGYAPISGLADLVDFYLNRRVIKSGQHVIELICEADKGRAVSATGSFAGLSHDNRPLSTRFCDVYRFEAGKIRQRETFFSSPAV
jgi:ketosteroid isomerase-like protein